MIKTGIGFDAHQLAEGKKLIIGGVKIKSAVGSVGHSDGDALLHAIVDALLGAAALGDIGKLFPSEDTQWENMNSLYFLSQAGKELKKANFEIYNIDTIIILQKPKVGNYITKIQNNISRTLELRDEQVSVKATTTDFMGYIGRGQGYAAQAIATIKG